jgi:nitrile hydratase accessory protein
MTVADTAATAAATPDTSTPAGRAADEFPILPGLPNDGSEPVFHAPWEAHIFAMAVSLHQQGLFTWSEWAQTLAEQITTAQANGAADLGDTYYYHWLAALEKLVSAKAGSSMEELGRYQAGWRRAAERTPHGQAIELQAGDL